MRIGTKYPIINEEFAFQLDKCKLAFSHCCYIVDIDLDMLFQ